jgi:topoisomerase-4 subunit A
VKIADKVFVGKDILHIDVWKKADERKVYHAVYLDGKTGRSFVKRFTVTAVTRTTEYDLTQGTPGSKVTYLTVHPNSEAEEITITLHPTAKAKNKVFPYNFGELAIKGRTAQGNTLTPHPIKSIKQTSVGSSTLGGRRIWLDETIGRLNTDERGKLLGEFDTGERILIVYKNGSYELTDYELTNRYEMNDILSIEKLLPETIVSCIYYHGEKKMYFVKRFKIETTTTNQRFFFVDENKTFSLTYATTSTNTAVTYDYQPAKNKKETAHAVLADMIDVKGWKVLGNKLTEYKILAVRAADAIPPNTAKKDELF